MQKSPIKFDLLKGWNRFSSFSSFFFFLSCITMMRCYTFGQTIRKPIAQTKAPLMMPLCKLQFLLSHHVQPFYIKNVRFSDEIFSYWLNHVWKISGPDHIINSFFSVLRILMCLKNIFQLMIWNCSFYHISSDENFGDGLKIRCVYLHCATVAWKIKKINLFSFN